MCRELGREGTVIQSTHPNPESSLEGSSTFHIDYIIGIWLTTQFAADIYVIDVYFKSMRLLTNKSLSLSLNKIKICRVTPKKFVKEVLLSSQFVLQLNHGEIPGLPSCQDR